MLIFFIGETDVTLFVSLQSWEKFFISQCILNIDLMKNGSDNYEEWVGQVQEEPYLHWFDARSAG